MAATAARGADLKLFFGLAGGITLGSAATYVLNDPMAMEAVGGALSTLDPAAGARAGQAVASAAAEAWPFYVGATAMALAWQAGKPLGEAARVWLTNWAHRHDAREIKRQNLAKHMKPSSPGEPAP